MNNYNITGNGCFAGECFVYIMKSEIKHKIQIKDVKIGDLLLSQNNVWAKVTHILKTKLHEPIDMIVMNVDSNNNNNNNSNNIYDNCVLTPWHPIYNQTTELWEFPQESSITKKNIVYNGEAMYDFVLENNYSVNVGGIDCITLGHNLNNYGDLNLRLSDMSDMSDFEEDFVSPNYSPLTIKTIDNHVYNHPYFGTQEVIDDLNLLSDNGYVTITKEYFQRDPETKKICKIKKPDQLK